MDYHAYADVKDVTLYYQLKRYLYLGIKRVFDIICALIGLLFLIPITIIVKIAYMLQGDFHSIFYTQNRIGKNGKEFKFFKFRSMCVNADEVFLLRTW